MFYIVLLLVLFVLAKLGIIPVKKWFHLGCALIVSAGTRRLIKLRAWLAK